MRRAGAAAVVAALCIAAPRAAEAPPAASFARPLSIPAPADNPLTLAKADLGRRLFNDAFLSESGARACASCHYPIQTFTDGLAKARAGGKELKRNTPALWNLAWSTALFWDGRAASLEEQARTPLTSPDEMGRSLAEAAQRIAARPSYAEDFARAFPDDPQITAANLARALASYERSLVSPQTRFDRWAAADAGALNASETRGFALFTGAGGCAACHAGFAFTDSRLHQIGATDADPGAGAHTFRTAPLRELLYTAPYLHDGSAATLEEAIAAHRGEAGAAQSLDAQARADIIAFLTALSSPAPPVAAPPLDDAGVFVTHVTPR